MKITRHTGSDIRHALRAVRDSLGADAVILATRRTANGVEITAAMDFDADNVQDATAQVKKVSLATPTPPALPRPSVAPPATTLLMAATPPAPPAPTLAIAATAAGPFTPVLPTRP